MMLTKQKLNKILRNYRVHVPSELKKELLEQYGNTCCRDGRTIEYSSRIFASTCEIVRSHENANKEVK